MTHENLPQKAPMVATKSGLVLGTLEEMWRFGEAVVRSRMFPHFVDPTQVIVAIEFARELGIPIMLALQNIYFVRGRAVMYGDAMLAAATATGLLEDIRTEYSGKPEDKTLTCRVTVKRKGIISPFVREFSLADAERAGLLEPRGDRKEPSPYHLYPHRMLQARARAYALRDSGLLAGVYLSEEIKSPQRSETSEEIIDVPMCEDHAPTAPQESASPESGSVEPMGAEAVRSVRVRGSARGR